MRTSPVDWQRCRLVVFDVDGTLYDQTRLRRRIVPRLLAAALRTRDRKLLAIVAALRSERERLAVAETSDFERLLLDRVAARCRVPRTKVANVLAAWLEERPLPHLLACRVEGAAPLFEALRASGRRIGVLSDYPAPAKLKTLGLAADYVVCATDHDIGVLKPHPKGLAKLLEAAACDPADALFVGDRRERDGEVARRLGVPCLIRERRPSAADAFTSFDDALFAPLLGAAQTPTAG